MNRDTQRQRLYDWEGDTVPQGPTLSLEDCQHIVDQVWADYHDESDPPAVVDGRGRRNAGGSRYKISLPVWARNLRTVLHEVSHSIVGSYKVAPHGPEYLRLFIDLLDHWGLSNSGELSRSARAAKLRIGTVAACPQPLRQKRIAAAVAACMGLSQAEFQAVQRQVRNSKL